jgi:hypothetical protein
MGVFVPLFCALISPPCFNVNNRTRGGVVADYDVVTEWPDSETNTDDLVFDDGVDWHQCTSSLFTCFFSMLWYLPHRPLLSILMIFLLLQVLLLATSAHTRHYEMQVKCKWTEQN